MKSDTYTQGHSDIQRTWASFSLDCLRHWGSYTFIIFEETHSVLKKVFFDHILMSNSPWLFGFEQRESCFLSLTISMQTFTSGSQVSPGSAGLCCRQEMYSCRLVWAEAQPWASWPGDWSSSRIFRFRDPPLSPRLSGMKVVLASWATSSGNWYERQPPGSLGEAYHNTEKKKQNPDLFF